MKMRLAVAALVSVMAAAASPGAALGNPATPGGCPQGYVAFDRQTGDGVPPSYEQGEEVVASGVLIDTAAGVPHVTLRSGAADGPELGRAVVAADGSWQGLAFTVPETVADGTYLVYLEARDRNGTMLTGLPYPFQIEVGPPPAPRQGVVAPTAGAVDADAMADRVRTALREAKVTPPRPAVSDRSVAAPRAAEAGGAAAPRAAVALRPSARRVDRAPGPRPSERRRADRDAPFADTPAPVPPARTERPVEAPTARTATRDGGGTPWSAVGLGLAVLAAGGVVLRRRRPRGERAVVAQPLVGPPPCPVEAELQVIIAEETRELDRGRDLARV